MTFRAAPAHRWIPVYGKLISTWPVAGGVVVQDGVVYAAAGIAHYDGTHVYALDAASGQLEWYNDSSGVTSEKANHGVSLQGSLYVQAGEPKLAVADVQVALETNAMLGLFGRCTRAVVVPFHFAGCGIQRKDVRAVVMGDAGCCVNGPVVDDNAAGDRPRGNQLAAAGN